MQIKIGVVHAQNDYDALGQLIRKSVGGSDVSGVSSLQKVDYRYTIRGWLTAINDVEEQGGVGSDDLFAFKINYNEIEHNFGAEVKGLFNGNIAQTFWKTDSDTIRRSYGYKYDGLNRLLKGIYQKENEVTHSYDEIVTYDKNGNIKTILRNGYQDGSSQMPAYEIDHLIYSYNNNSNQLGSVRDISNKTDGFRDGNPSAIDYDYDLYGNRSMDLNKKMNGINYNHLNLPVNVNFNSGAKITYLYNAVGMKINKKISA